MHIEEIKKHDDTNEENSEKLNIDGDLLLRDLLNKQEEIISSPIRFNGVSIENITRVFAKFGIDYKKHF